ncbi:hypothetical protein PsAD2_04088 [Pseudovibrio axinellae]|uniref:DUF2849 domain-containing protein n=1 Tax=Pseudovibrio axinellae TaxID=989403 RepID=A0A165U2D1_9HYPH|nr:DUF2849 domain-containing protein [Pseudovibrio axinellae]KZL09486.1 hypothetical protein PsAD2_04088 [Pseudovibrio axinellae]SEQ63328.1 Protein of unknown function [Pseudovibrio axinellae]
MKTITANRLVDGDVVWLGRNGDWVEFVEAAWILNSEEEMRAAEEFAKAGEASQYVLGTYAIDLELKDGHLQPTALKERIRAKGPTTRLDLGKQAQRLLRSA